MDDALSFGNFGGPSADTKPSQYLNSAYEALKYNPQQTQSILAAASQGQQVGLQGLAAMAAAQNQQNAKAGQPTPAQNPQTILQQLAQQQGIVNQLPNIFGAQQAPPIQQGLGNVPPELPPGLAGGGLVALAGGGMLDRLLSGDYEQPVLPEDAMDRVKYLQAIRNSKFNLSMDVPSDEEQYDIDVADEEEQTPHTLSPAASKILADSPMGTTPGAQVFMSETVKEQTPAPAKQKLANEPETPLDQQTEATVKAPPPKDAAKVDGEFKKASGDAHAPNNQSQAQPQPQAADTPETRLANLEQALQKPLSQKEYAKIKAERDRVAAEIRNRNATATPNAQKVSSAPSEKPVSSPAPASQGIGSLGTGNAEQAVQAIEALRGGAYKMSPEMEKRYMDAVQGAKEDKWLSALAAAGAGYFGSSSPFRSQALGQGMMTGLAAYLQGAGSERALEQNMMQAMAAQDKAGYDARQGAADKYLATQAELAKQQGTLRGQLAKRGADFQDKAALQDREYQLKAIRDSLNNDAHMQRTLAGIGVRSTTDQMKLAELVQKFYEQEYIPNVTSQEAAMEKAKQLAMQAMQQGTAPAPMTSPFARVITRNGNQ